MIKVHGFGAAGNHPRMPGDLSAPIEDDAERMLRRLHTANEGEGLIEAELLVANAFPLDSITLIGVCNDKVRASVREVITNSAAGASGFAPKVAVYPPWFVAQA